MATAKATRATARREGALPVRLHLRVHSGLRVSERAFALFCRDNPDLRLERTAKGELIVMAPAGTDSGFRNMSLSGQLWLWNSRENLGIVGDSSTGFTLPNGAIRAPDAVWIARDRWESLPVQDRRGFARTYPDFVIELRSESDSFEELRAKMREYIEQGTKLGWLIDPLTSRVEIYVPGREVEILTRPVTLSGEPLLPGFVLDLSGILKP